VAEAGLVDDPVTGHRTQLGPQSAGIFAALATGAHTVETLCEATRLDADTTARRLRQIDCALLLDSPRWRSQRALFAASPGRPERPLRLSPGLRHRCVRCGSSCHGVHIGPVPPATCVAAEQQGVWRTLGAASAADLFVQIGDRHFMARRDDACVALRPDARCALHDVAKPGVCRQFPYTLTRTPDAIHVGLQLECRSLPEALAAASDDAEAELLDLLEADAQIYDLPAAIPLVPGVFVGASALLDWLRPHADRISAETGVPWSALLDDLCVQALPFVASHAHRIDDQWCPEHAPPDADSALGALRTALGEACEGPVRGALDAAFGEPLPPIGWDPAATALLQTALTAELHGLEVVRDRDLLFGLGRTRLTLTLSETVARRRAGEVGRHVVRPRDVNDGLVVVSRAVRTGLADAALRRHATGIRWLGAAPGRPFEAWMGVVG